MMEGLTTKAEVAGDVRRCVRDSATVDSWGICAVVFSMDVSAQQGTVSRCVHGLHRIRYLAKSRCEMNRGHHVRVYGKCM